MKNKYFLLKILIFLLSPLAFAQNPVPTVEYQALVDFYNQMGGDNWQNKWDITSNNLHTTSWYGVVVENEHIVEINLAGNRVQGAVPTSFSNLNYLRKLDLNSNYYLNDLSTTDLNNLAGLESLEYLNFNNCKIAGTIPSSWSQLTNLKTLVLSNNLFAGTIFSEIGNLTALETIDLSYNSFDAIPASIANLTNLKTLNLRDNALKTLPQVMESLTSLTTLNLYYNEISTIEALLNTSINLYLNYQTITLDEFAYNGEDVLLTNLPNITKYNRSLNDFSALNSFYLRIDGANIVTSLQMNEDGSLLLEKQYLSSLTPEKQVALYLQNGNAAGSYINFTTTSVDLPEVPEIEYQALVDFYNATAGASWFNKWDVSTNNLNLGPWYGLVIENGHIAEINLPGNRIVGAIPASFSNLKFLRKFDLNSNYYLNDLSTTDLNNLVGLESLEYLNLNNCKIAGPIPSSWSQLTKLKTLVLSNNTLSGSIFNEIGNLTDLVSIDLSRNSFTTIPDSIGNLTALETIDFSYNNIEEIPATIASLTNLKTLNLRDNALKTLPQVMESLTSLTTLNLYYNEISSIEALLSTSINLYLNYQTITLDEFVYSGEDVLLTDLPNITRYNRSLNDFSALNSFYLRIDGANIVTGLKMNEDGSLLLEKQYLSSLTPEKQVALYQQNGNAAGSYLNFTTTTVTLPEVPEIEYQALVDFYNATAGASWFNKWDVSTNNLSLGPWYGLVIENGHIAEINLPGNRIVGAIPASFSNLKFLRKFDLNSNYYLNDLSTTDLNNLSGLESLEYLNLNNCKIAGPIPSSWSQLTKLKTLVLSNNTLEGSIFSEIGNLTDLVSIDLSRNSFTTIPDSIGNLTALEIIDFSYNNIEAIPATIASLTNLKTLNLRDNALKTLPQVMESLTSLTTLNLYYNEISTIEALLSTSIALYLNYQTITLDEFVYSGEDVLLTDLPNITRYNRSLNDFSALNSFYLRIDGANIVTNLQMNADGSLLLEKQYLSSLTPEKQVALYLQNGNAAGSYINFTTTSVDLQEVPEIEYQALVDFYNATAGASWFNKWDVSTNNLNLGPWYGLVIENGHIAEINLPGNRIVGAIPASFSNLKFLRKFDLNSNYYLNDLSTTDLNNLSGLESLEDLNLNNCKIAGPIPSSWSQLIKLKTLVLSNNTLEGSIFSEIGNLTDLETINLSRNKLTSIPATLGYLTNLKSLDLSYNALTNSDTDFSTLTLTTLNFRYQDIKIESIEIGANEINIDLPIPLTAVLTNGVVSIDAKNEFQLFVNNVYKKTSFSNNGKLVFSNINILNLQVTDKLRVYQTNGAAIYSNINYNAITFGLPLVDEEFEILKKLYTATNGDSWTNSWDISENNLNIESWFGVSIKDGHVVSINLFNNNLTGSIPTDVVGLTNLKTFALNTNKIGGSIPSNINLLTNLETLDLSSNLLTGNIPNGIADLQKLKKFAIGNNKFAGTIPSALSDFIALEYLDISSNSFDFVEKKLYYDFTKTYIDLRNQIINYNTLLNLEGTQLTVELGNIVKYDLENNNFDAKNNFVLLVNDVTHTSTTTNDLGEIIFDNVRIGEIPSDAKISIRQTTGTFRNTEFNYVGIEDKSNIPVIQEEYMALVQLFNNLNGDQWTNKWVVTSNNLHTNKWYGVSTYDGHIVAIDLSANNVSNIVPNVFGDLPFLNKLNLSSNKITGIAGALPETIDFTFDRQTVEAGEINLNINTVFNDFSVNKYEHKKQDFFNQSYFLKIGSYSKTVNLSEVGIKLVDLIRTWKVPDNQKLELRQISGDAKNSIINYYLKYKSGDSNLDSNLNVLDIQTSINYIMNNYVYYFNYNAADIDNSNSINILDIIKQVTIIQDQAVIPTSGKSSIAAKTSDGPSSKLSIENGALLLDTNGREVASFEILIKGTSKEAVTELISPLGFIVNSVNKNNYVNIIAYSFNATLNGKIELAKIANQNTTIQSVILSDINAVEIPSEILGSTLSTSNLELLKLSKSFNYPNPFTEETTIDFYVDSNSEKSTLSIYDLSGRNVEKIEMKNLIRGKNQYLFKRKKLTSGMYFYIISTGDYKAILKGKMIIE